MKVKDKDNIERYCKYCEMAHELFFEEQMLCREKGVVSSAACCRKFSYDPLKRDPARLKLKSEETELPVIDE